MVMVTVTLRTYHLGAKQSRTNKFKEFGIVIINLCVFVGKGLAEDAVCIAVVPALHHNHCQLQTFPKDRTVSRAARTVVR